MWNRSLDEARSTWHDLRYRHPVLATLAFENLKRSDPVLTGEYANLGQGVDRDTINLVAASAQIRHALYLMNHIEEWLIRSAQDAKCDAGMCNRSTNIANALRHAGLDTDIKALSLDTSFNVMSDWAKSVWKVIGDAGIDLERLQAIDVSSTAEADVRSVAIEVEQIVSQKKGQPLRPTDKNGHTLEQVDTNLIQALKVAEAAVQGVELTIPSGMRDTYREAYWESWLYEYRDGQSAQELRERTGLFTTGFPPRKELECNRQIPGRAVEELRAIVETFWRELGGDGQDRTSGSSPRDNPPPRPKGPRIG